MIFRTKFDLPTSDRKIGHQHPLISFGSCFADSIGTKLQLHGFHIEINPFGTLYSPASIARLVRGCRDGRLDFADYMVEVDHTWRNYLTHSRIWAPTLDELAESLTKTLYRTATQLRSADVIFITLGTAFAWRLKATGTVVANCHKQPADLFERTLLGIDEITASLREIIEDCRQMNSNCRIILTVSPVRHLRDGLADNNRSKAILLLAAHDMVDQFDFVEYFPAYELLLDDLRDYRFYARDLTHPSEAAIDYIYQRFDEVYFTDRTREINREVEKIRRRIAHRPLYNRERNREEINLLIEDFRRRFPMVDFVHCTP